MSENKTYKHWRLSTDQDNILWIELDQAETSTNVLCRAVVEELESIVGDIEKQRPAGVILRSAKQNGFIAGADIKEFTTLKGYDEAVAMVRRAQGVLDRIEALSCPTVALIHGFCLGGGLELALACRYRLANDDPKTKLGLPEVNLGIHPGFGGTVRLPPLIGAPAAMDMMLTGRTLSARAAAKLGVIDYAVPQRHLETAARKMVQEKPPRRRPKGWLAYSNNALLRPILAMTMRKQVAKKARKEHYPAPYALIDLWAKHAGDPRTMMKEEAASISRLVVGATAQNLVRVFFLQEQLKAQGNKSEFKAKRVHVIGGGVMGGDIAAWCALQGLKVTIQDRKHETLARVIKNAHGLYKKKLKDARLVTAALDRLIPDIHGHGVADADVIIEAIYENIEAKQALFREVEAKAKPDAVIATNTSSIPLEVLCTALQKPERLVGLHFFNPVAKMQLVEIVYGAQTGAQEIQRAAAFAKQISRLPLPVKSAPGFLVNRVLMPYLLEAVTLTTEGISPVVIDQAAVKFGMPMGPIELADTVGLDICLHVAEILTRELGGQVPGKLRQMVEAGKLGRKSGEGFYRYEKGKIVQPAAGGSHAPDDLTERLIMRLVNECMACLREGVVENAELLDAGVIFGTGFAPFRGGPMRYAKDRGNAQIQQQLAELKRLHGERFSPDSGWSAPA
ncbi:MAG: 3-hydroxyacyl-CoA dehydrogenase NAD-binding domain-containing protein [Pseudomonadota bacterium]